MEEITREDWLFLVGLADDYRGLHSIPFEYSLLVLPDHKMGQPMPRKARVRIETLISEIYERLFQAGWIEIYLFDSLGSSHGTKISGEKALNQIRNLKNYNFENIPLPLVCAAVSSEGATIVQKYKEFHEHASTE